MTTRKDPADLKPRGGKRSRHMATALTPEEAARARKMHETYFVWHLCDVFKVSRSTMSAVLYQRGAYREKT